jgi:hypothetical protein
MRMQKLAVVVLVSSALVLSAVLPGAARGRGGSGHFRGRVIVGVGPAFWWGPYPYWWPYPPPFYEYPPVQEPVVYIEQPAPTRMPEVYWYYCDSSKAYYPTVQTCPGPWTKVPPQP